jgi:diaminopimelate decarboxylase/aspartate kinase
MSHRPTWVVLKFGGTSVSTLHNWRIIASEVSARLREGLRPLVVCSALAGVSNTLEKLISEALAGRHEPLLDSLVASHRALGAELGVDTDRLLGEHFEALRRVAAGISLLGEATPRLHARVLAEGELMSTRLGAAFLSAAGLDIGWLDARDLLLADPPAGPGEFRTYLSATCVHEPDPAWAEQLASLSPALITQGFIAKNAAGETVLLGRGGSDTSACYLAARLRAARCEIWTDVSGMYSANPRQVPDARLLRALGYDEAQELASAGAKVLHPRCIGPVRRHGIPLHIRCTAHPDAEGTIISDGGQSDDARVKAIAARPGVTLISMDTAGMWQQVGFLADVFAAFKARGLSIDLVSTSEMNVTVSLDGAANTLDATTLHALLQDLEPYCRARVLGPCAAISLVGRNIRAILHRLGPALELFQEQRIHLVSQAASDLNLTFVVDVDQADRLVQQLHELLFQHAHTSAAFGPPWGETFGDAHQEVTRPAWWATRSAELLELVREQSPLYVYDTATLQDAAQRLLSLGSVDRLLYAVKANPFAPVLRLLHELGLGFECVSPGEVEHVLNVLPGIHPADILFTPNFAPRAEYERALALGVRLTLDNLHPLQAWPELFRGAELFVRIDPGQPRGHHEHVRTAGAQSKFGIPPSRIEQLAQLVQRCGARVTGLHAHRGSGIRVHQEWARTARALTSVADLFPDVTVLDLGGGLGVPERPAHAPMDLQALDASLQAIKRGWPRFELWLEPGRFLVAEAGVLLATVTQLKSKGEASFVGIDAGMNSLIRPALYGAWHEIVNLSRLQHPASMVADIVGPICESGDTLGHARRIAAASEGDVLLIATTGAYGHAMSSHYNLRAPAAEVMLPAPRAGS